MTMSSHSPRRAFPIDTQPRRFDAMALAQQIARGDLDQCTAGAAVLDLAVRERRQLATAYHELLTQSYHVALTRDEADEHLRGLAAGTLYGDVVIYLADSARFTWHKAATLHITVSGQARCGMRVSGPEEDTDGVPIAERGCVCKRCLRSAGLDKLIFNGL